MNICVECRYFKRNAFDEIRFHECKHPECRNPVSGRAQPCVDMRKAKGPCGLQGNKWEPEKGN